VGYSATDHGRRAVRDDTPLYATMTESDLLHDLVQRAAQRTPEAPALTMDAQTLDYAALRDAMSHFAGGLREHGLGRTERVGIYLEKRFETVIASFGAPAAGGVFVPMNPLLKPEQVGYIARVATASSTPT
jgi:acyl-CoA synthetase (AMP-forming)/AMP-acid ligase II